jgi:glycosyltransferase involved in cell wall biosynthesis
MKALRVVSLIDSLAPGGAERSLVELVPHLADHGIEVTVALLYERVGYDEELRSSGTSVVQLEPEGTAGRIRQIRSLLADSRADLLHTTLYESDILGRIAGTAARVPIVCTLANVRYGPEQYAEPGLVRWKLQAAQAVDVVTARAVRRFHAVSSTVAQGMGRALRVPARRMVVVPRGRDERRLGRWGEPRRAAARRAFGLEGDQPVVLAVSRHEHQKGLDVLVDAAAGLRGRHPDLTVLVAGREGRQTAELERRIADRDLSTNFLLLGARDEVPDLLCAADAFALPSRREGFPGAVVEAMALEVPMVLTDLPMVREAAPADSMAWFVPVGDSDALADALHGALTDTAGAAARVAAARARFESELTIEAVARRMADLFRDAAR